MTEDPPICLVLDDDFVVRSHVAMTLKGMGVSRIETCDTVKDALAILETHPVRFAILDYLLGGGETSAGLAARMKDTGIPFVVTTGLGEIEAAPDALADAPILDKPVDPDALRSYLSAAGLLPEP